MSAPLRSEVLAPPQRAKIPPRRIADENDVSPMPPVAAVRPTARHMGLTPERDRPVAATAALNPDFRLVVHRGSQVWVSKATIIPPKPRAIVAINPPKSCCVER